MAPSGMEVYLSKVRGVAASRTTMCRLRPGMTFSAFSISASAYALFFSRYSLVPLLGKSW